MSPDNQEQGKADCSQTLVKKDPEEHDDMKEADEGEPETKKEEDQELSPEQSVKVEIIPEDPIKRLERLSNLPAKGILVSVGFR